MRGTIMAMVVGLLALAPAAARADEPPDPSPAVPISMSTDPDGTQHYKFLYGPLTAAPGQNLILIGPQSVAAPPVDGYITRFKPDLIGADGKPPRVDVIHMHHAVFLNMSRQDVTDPGLPERMFAFAEEKTIATLPKPYGYRYRASDVLAINYMLHNETPNPAPVWIAYDLTFVPDGTPAAQGMLPAQPVWLDVENGKTYPVFDVHRGAGVNGEFTFPDDAKNPYAGGPALNQWTVPHDASLVSTAGHVHPGGLWTDLKSTRAGVTKELFRSTAHYFDPLGPVSWDMAMEYTPPDWKIAVDKGDRLSVSATYETKLASWYESMGIMLVLMVDDQKGAVDPFAKGASYPTSGSITHGELPEATHFGGEPTPGAPDPATLPDGSTINDQVGIADFTYLPGDQFSSFAPANPPTIRPGQSLTFGNLDATGSVLHTITACKAPCNGATGVAYPLANGNVEFDSGQLGYGPTGLTAAKNDAQWKTPSNLTPGTYTYFCRVHPFMRGSFRVIGTPARAVKPTARVRLSTAPIPVRNGIATVRVACRSGDGPCDGTLALDWRGTEVGRSAFHVASGKRGTVRVRLNAAGRKGLARRHRLTVRVLATGAGPSSGAQATLTGPR